MPEEAFILHLFYFALDVQTASNTSLILFWCIGTFNQNGYCQFFSVLICFLVSLVLGAAVQLCIYATVRNCILMFCCHTGDVV